MTMRIQVKKVNKDGQVPLKAHKTDAGFDVFAAEDLLILPGERHKLGSGIAIDLPAGWEIEIRGRSGLNGNTGLHVANGTVDAGYQGEIILILKNTNPEYDGSSVDITDKQDLKQNATNYKAAYHIKKGSRVAQLLFHRVENIDLYLVDEFGETTERGDKGFGSTGV